MLASRLPGLLPDLTPAEALQVSTVHSVAGLLVGGLMVKRPPYREPHHSASPAALTGGGQRARPGEVSLAHRGVLFLDELPEFPRPALEALRTPLETGAHHGRARRGAHHLPSALPADRGDEPVPLRPSRRRRRASAARRRAAGRDYLNRISGPLLDRIDMTVQVQPIAPVRTEPRPRRARPSAAIAGRVARARPVPPSAQRGAINAEADSAARWRWNRMPAPSRNSAAEKLRLSARGFTRILRVGRTVADLAGAEAVRRADVAEALAFRHRVPGRSV